MELTLNWKEKLSFEGTSQEGHKILISNDRDENNDRKGFSPLYLLALGLGACSSMDVISILQKKQQIVDDFEIKINYGQRDEAPRVWETANVEYIVTGKNVDPEALERSIQISIEKYCAAHAMLSQAVDITTSFQIIES